MVDVSANNFPWALAAAVVFGLVVGLAELLQTRRMVRIGTLAFGPTGRPASWVVLVPFARTIAAAALAAALVTLMLLEPMSHRKDGSEVAFEKLKHVVIVLDVSPSMRLRDAGMTGEQSRMMRAREVMESYFQRVPMTEFRVSVIAVYTDAFPVVKDTKDPAVVRNILNDLPMHFAFVPGETDLFSGIRKAAELARGWRPRSATVILVTDGDTVPSTGMPKMPASVSEVVVVGIGDVQKGSFINGKNSRQDVSTLRQIAARLGGVYHNGNEKHLSTALLDRLTEQMDGESRIQLTSREFALIAAAASITILALIPLILHYMGTNWQPGIRSHGSQHQIAGPGRTSETSANRRIGIEHQPVSG